MMHRQFVRRIGSKPVTETLSGKTISEAKSHFKSTSGPFVEELIQNESYKSFFSDFEKSQVDKTRITSFEEQKSFNQVLDFLTQNQNRVGVVESLRNEIGLDSKSNKGFKFSFFSKKSHPLNLEMRYEQKQMLNKTISQSLAPTLTYINNEINDSKQMYDYVQSSIIKPFISTAEATATTRTVTKPNNTSQDQDALIKQIETVSLKTPNSPLINNLSLPILLRFCFNSLINDFGSLETCTELVNYIKQHPSIELYGYGMNIDVYNTLLIQTWSKTGDLKLIGKLIDELKANAIQHDLLTYKIISKIYLKCFRVKDGILAEPYILWNNRTEIYKMKAYLDSIVVL